MSDRITARALRTGSRRMPVRVVGTVDGVCSDERLILLNLDDGVQVPVIVREGDPWPGEAHPGSRAVVSGTGVWSLPGHLLRIDADWVGDGTGEAAGWSQTPAMPSRVSDLPEEVASPPRQGLAALIGLLRDEDLETPEPPPSEAEAR